jgi:hypothetical protein
MHHHLLVSYARMQQSLSFTRDIPILLGWSTRLFNTTGSVNEIEHL